MDLWLLFLCALGVAVRAAIFYSPLSGAISERVELSTPQTAWRRVVEALTLLDLGVSPYEGDTFHEVVDITTTVILYLSAKKTALHLWEKQKSRKWSVDVSAILLRPKSLHWLPLHVAAAYLLNPLTIATCVARSTCALHNLLLALLMLATQNNSIILSAVFLALASYESLYPVVLLLPVILQLAQKEVKGKLTLRNPYLLCFILEYTVVFLGCLSVLLMLSYSLLYSSDFIPAVYGFILSVPDLTPNVGLFWYFFTEVFEHFRLFFICIFQLNAFIYTLPLIIVLSDHPQFLMFIQIALLAVFKSYPNLGDVAFYLALLPTWAHLNRYLRNSFLVLCLLLSCGVLFPILWHLWVFSGSANANFYYAATLAFSTAQILLISDYLYAFRRREFHLKHGIEIKTEDGRKMMVELK
uniref:phosphatidylinositol glycan anchor biosynthesis class U protein isoform X2 n=1 Tax=Myxine glutinosa TaxID=7769 RepID=UPI00358FF5AD